MNVLYPHGQMHICVSTDSDGKIHGTYQEFYPNGTNKVEIEYKHGVLHGQATFYREDGLVLESTVYQDGVAVFDATDLLGGAEETVTRAAAEQKGLMPSRPRLRFGFIPPELIDPQAPRN